MKASAFIATLLATVTFLSAHSTPLPVGNPSDTFLKCREFNPETTNHLSASTLIGFDLVNGQWNLKSSAGWVKSFYFDAGGKTGILIHHVNGHTSYTTAAWKVKLVNGQPVLTLKDNKGKEKSYQVEQTCEGLLLTDEASRKPLILTYEPLKKRICLQRIKDRLTGEWTSVTYFESTDPCENAAGSYLNYRFSSDGTYHRNYGSRKRQITEKGTWEISKEGQFLLLHEDEKNGPETKVIRIAQVDEHGLILEPVMVSDDISEFFCTQTDTFAFIK